MKFPGFSISKRIWIASIAAFAMSFSSVMAWAEGSATDQTPISVYTVPASKLQVTGTSEKFTVDADNADVQSLLKAVFDQAKEQFTADNSAVGHVTMRLTEQSLSTVLDAICKQLLLKNHKNEKGIYLFEQDFEATKAAISRLRDLDALMRQQLRTFGLDLPEDLALAARQPSVVDAPKANGQAGFAQTGPASGLFGGGAAGAQGPSGRAIAKSADAPKMRRQPAPGPPGTAAERSAAGGRFNYLTDSDLAEIFAIDPQSNSLLNPNSYRQFIQQNGLVFINTGHEKTPVAEVLEEMGRQSNTRIIVDPSVPTGPKFNMLGYITPRTLPEALNVLTQSTRLNWRWMGSQIYVNALPDFQLFYNSTPSRRGYNSNVYPPQQLSGQQSNAPAVPVQTQTPLPITNGSKKTP